MTYRPKFNTHFHRTIPAGPDDFTSPIIPLKFIRVYDSGDIPGDPTSFYVNAASYRQKRGMSNRTFTFSFIPNVQNTLWDYNEDVGPIPVPGNPIFTPWLRSGSDSARKLDHFGFRLIAEPELDGYNSTIGYTITITRYIQVRRPNSRMYNS